MANWRNGPARDESAMNLEFEDGDQLLVAVSVCRNEKGQACRVGDAKSFYLEYSVVRVSCDEDFAEMDTHGGDWGWDWSDVEWWLPMKEIAALGVGE